MAAKWMRTPAVYVLRLDAQSIKWWRNEKDGRHAAPRQPSMAGERPRCQLSSLFGSVEGASRKREWRLLSCPPSGTKKAEEEARRPEDARREAEHAEAERSRRNASRPKNWPRRRPSAGAREAGNARAESGGKAEAKRRKAEKKKKKIRKERKSARKGREGTYFGKRPRLNDSNRSASLPSGPSREIGC